MRSFVDLRQPDWTALPPSTPSSVRRLLGRCLEKDLRRRLHDIADVRIEVIIAKQEMPSDIVLFELRR